MLQRLLGHTTLMMTNRYCQAVGCYGAVEAHKRYNRVNTLFGLSPTLLTGRRKKSGRLFRWVAGILCKLVFECLF